MARLVATGSPATTKTLIVGGNQCSTKLAHLATPLRNPGQSRLTTTSPVASNAYAAMPV